MSPEASSASNAGCGRFRCRVASCAPLVVVFFEIDPPALAVIEAQLLLALVGQQIERAFDVLRGERLAVVPFDAVAQLEGQLGAVLVPCPARGELGHDRLHAVLRNVLVENDEIVEDAHHRHDDADRPLLVDRHAGRAVAVIDPQVPPCFCAVAGNAARRSDRRRRTDYQSLEHSRPSRPPSFGAVAPRRAIARRGAACPAIDAGSPFGQFYIPTIGGGATAVP